MRRRVGVILAATALVACGNGADDRGGTRSPGVAEPLPTTSPVATLAPAEDETVDRQPVVVETGDQDVRTITVGGMGAGYGPPVSCTVDLAVSTRRPSVHEASRAASAAGDALVDTLRAAGVPEASIQTSQFWIHPVYDQHDYQRISAYEVTLGYRVTMPDTDLTGSALADAIAAGGDNVRASSIRFEADATGLMDAARTQAWADVRARAEDTADLIGEPLGQVLDAHEKVLVTTPQGMMQGGEGDVATFDIPVSPGVAGVTVLLTVTYEIGA